MTILAAACGAVARQKLYPSKFHKHDSGVLFFQGSPFALASAERGRWAWGSFQGLRVPGKEPRGFTVGFFSGRTIFPIGCLEIGGLDLNF